MDNLYQRIGVLKILTKPELSNDEQRKLSQKAFWVLDHRIKIFTSLPINKLDKLSLQKQLDEIGKSYP